jgi:hypothetical protein
LFHYVLASSCWCHACCGQHCCFALFTTQLLLLAKCDAVDASAAGFKMHMCWHIWLTLYTAAWLALKPEQDTSLAPVEYMWKASLRLADSNMLQKQLMHAD